MGIQIHGTCLGCHRTCNLHVDEQFCTEECKIRYRDSIIWGQGFGSGILLTLAICAILAAYAYWHQPKSAKLDPIMEAEHRMVEVQIINNALKAMSDAAAIQLSNDLQRAIQTRELEKH